MAKESRQVKAINIISAIITRLLFIAHAWVAVYMTVFHMQNSFYWTLVIGLVLLFFESCYTITVRRAHEYKFLWPSCFFYLSCMIPCVWILEYHLYGQRLVERDAALSRNTTVACEQSNQNTEAQVSISNGGLYFSMDVLTNKWCELSTMFVMIGGRWLLPRGDISRDQLSALLLEFISIAADILELFDILTEDAVKYNEQVFYAVLTLYSWSMCQFILVTTATAGEEEVQLNKNKVAPEDPMAAYNKQIVNQRAKTAVRRKYIEKLEEQQQRQRALTDPKTRGKGRKANTDTPQGVTLNVVGDTEARKLSVHGDIYGILSSIVMQDGPFFILRVYLLIQYNINNDLLVFFICKNAITLTLMVYRLCVLTCRGEDSEEDLLDDRDSAWKFRSAQIAVATATVLRARVQTDENGQPYVHTSTTDVGQEMNGNEKKKITNKARGILRVTATRNDKKLKTLNLPQTEGVGE